MPLHYLVPSVDWMSVSCPSGIASLLVDDLRPIVSAVPGSCAMSSGDGYSISLIQSMIEALGLCNVDLIPIHQFLLFLLLALL